MPFNQVRFTGWCAEARVWQSWCVLLALGGWPLVQASFHVHASSHVWVRPLPRANWVKDWQSSLVCSSPVSDHLGVALLQMFSKHLGCSRGTPAILLASMFENAAQVFEIRAMRKCNELW